MKIREKLNDKNSSFLVGIFGFAILILLFGINIFTVEVFSPVNPSIVVATHKYSSYSLFFADTESIYYYAVSRIFFVVFAINFIFYLSLLVLRNAKKDSESTLFLGIIGILINFANLILFFCFLFTIEIDFNDILATFITFEFLGIFGTYASWIYACKKPVAEGSELQTKQHGKVYLILSLIQIGLFTLPITVILAILLLVFGLSGLGGLGDLKNGKSTAKFKSDKNNIITVGNMKYFVKDGKVFDIKTNKEVGRLEKDKVIFDIKRS